MMAETRQERLEEAREAVRSAAIAMATSGLATGSSGNVSLRLADRVLITASGIPYTDLEVDQVIEIDMEGNQLSGSGKPSSEWRMHVAIYRHRNDVSAIVHTHSPMATAAAIVLPVLPILHDEGKILFGDDIPVSVHCSPGSSELARAVAEALGDGRGALISKHGVVGVGASLAEAFEAAIKIEEAAQLVLLSRQFGAS